MLVTDGPVTPDALTAFVRQVPTPATYTLSTLFEDRTHPTNTATVAELTRTNRTARYRAFDSRLHVSQRDTGTIRQVFLPPLSSSQQTGELERLRLEAARQSGGSLSALATAIYDDATTLTREILARKEQAIGDLLTDGKFTLADEGGLSLEADFGVPATHIVSASTAWTTTATALALSNLLAWVDVYNATNGFLPGSMLTSLRVHRLLQTNAEIVGAIAGTTSGRTRVTLPEINDLFASNGLPQLRGPYDTQVDVDGTSTKTIPDDKIVFLPPTVSDLGHWGQGVSATALEMVNSKDVEMTWEDAPGIVGGVIKEGPPFREYTFVDAVGMPVLDNPRMLLVADVI
jgi:hypothetical protein